MTDEEILSVKIKDLPLDKNALPYPQMFRRLFKELKRRDILWRPHVWPSEEWFSPDGVPGFAFPFTLLDPRLTKLEKKIVGFIEGDSEEEFLKLIRHECAHAIDNAFHLRKNKRRQKIFGRSSFAYPSFYLPLPYSKNFVRHLRGNYAQAHPEEDWAETFAVWLTPKREWREKYKDWKALDKLDLVDQLMKRIKETPPKRESLHTPLHFKQDERTVKEYFAWRKTCLGLRRKNFYEKKLKGVFYKKQRTSDALNILSKYEKEICKNVSQRNNIRQHVVKNMIKELKSECKTKRYQLKYSPQRTKYEIEKIISRHSLEFVKKKRHRVFM